MSFILQPWQLVFVILASWVNRQQQQVIDYLRIENQVLKEKLGQLQGHLHRFSQPLQRNVSVRHESYDTHINLYTLWGICAQVR